METLFDDDWVDRSAGVRRVLATPRKEPHPVMAPEMPWEAAGVQPENGLFFDAEERVFKLWYRVTVEGRGVAEPQSGVETSEQTSGDKRVFLCYAISRDGLRWERPNLGRFEFRGRRDNNILCELDEGCHVWTNVLKDVDDPDPARRYKALGFDRNWETSVLARPGSRGVCVAYSADGLRWPDRARMVMTAGDLTDSNCLLPHRDPRSGKWVCFFRPRTAPKRRFIGYAESDDFEHWDYPRMLLTPDARDDEWTEFYGLTAADVGAFRVGLLWVFHNNPESSPMTIELAYSRDGRHFRRAMPGHEFLPLGAAGAFDSRMMAAVALIDRGPEHWVYYWGANFEHGSDRGMDMQRDRRIDGDVATSAVGMARITAGHFCGLRAELDGAVETKWLANYGDRGVEALAEVAPGGSIRAEILDPYGCVIPGWDAAACRSEETQPGHLRFWWGHEDCVGAYGQTRDADVAVGHVVKLRFHLHRATLFGFSAGQPHARPEYA